MPITSSTLDPVINENVVSDVEKKAVQTAIDIIERTKNAKIQKDTDNIRIQKLLEDGFSVKTPVGTKRVTGKMLAQAVFNVVNILKPLDFQIHGSGVREWLEQIVTMGVSTVMDYGGYASSLRDKNGAFLKLTSWGDAYMMIGANPDKDARSPIEFSPVSNANVYFDPFATVIRGSQGQAATKALVIFNMSWAEAIEAYPKLKEIGGKGKIPRESSIFKDLERKYENQPDLQKDEVEIAFFYDIVNLNYTIFAGRACTILEQYEGDDYPFYFTDSTGKEEAYIPIINFMCFPSFEGMSNYGIGHALYDIAITSRQLTNMGTNHALDVADPLWHFNLPKGEGGKFFEKMSAAQEMRAQGKKGFITTEYDPDRPGANQVGVNSLMGQSDFNMWTAMWERLDRELKRFGINLDETQYSSNPNQMEIMARDNELSKLAKQIMEWNASETKFAVEVTIEMIKKFVKKGDKTPLNLTTSVKAEGIEFRPDQMTLGMVADELRKNHYFVKVNSRSGAIPSNMMKMAQIDSVLQLTQPGSSAWKTLATRKANYNDLDVNGEDMIMEQQPTQAPEAKPTDPLVAQTDKLPLIAK